MAGTKHILISGGARGIGRCFARTFLEQGHKVFIVDILEDELEYCTKTHLKKYHESKHVESAVCNLRDVNAIRETVGQAAKFFDNKIDVLINNGSIASPYWTDEKTMEDPSTIDQWQAYMETNLTSPFVMSQACIPYMKSKEADHPTGAQKTEGPGPCIIHIGSFRAHQSDPNQEGYAASKAGQLGLMQAMSISLGPLGIRVNLIAPGRVKVTNESKEGDEKGQEWEETIEEKDAGDHPTNRPGRAEDIAQAADYLIHAGFVTGQDLTVDGGVLRKKNA